MGCLKCCFHLQLTSIWYTPVIGESFGRAAQLVKEADEFLTPVVLQAEASAAKMEYVAPSLKSIIIFISSQRAGSDISEEQCQSCEFTSVHRLPSRCVSHRALKPQFITQMKELRTAYNHIQFNNDKI